MENNKSKSKKNSKTIQNDLHKRMPNFLLSQRESSKLLTHKTNDNVVNIKKGDEEIIINCNDGHKTIPDNIYKYLCSIDINIKNQNNHRDDNLISDVINKKYNTNKKNEKNENNKSNEKKTKGGKKYRNNDSKKTRRKNKK